MCGTSLLIYQQFMPDTLDEGPANQRHPACQPLASLPVESFFGYSTGLSLRPRKSLKYQYLIPYDPFAKSLVL